MDKITLTGKVIVPIALIASAYLGLKFLAETKKNYRELKGKR
jgi:hypothetical protein